MGEPGWLSQVPHTLHGQPSDRGVRHGDQEARTLLHGLLGVHDQDSIRLPWLRRIFSTSIMDRHFKSDMTRTQAYALMVECVKEAQKRLVLNLPNFAVVVVDADGISNMDVITP